MRAAPYCCQHSAARSAVQPKPVTLPLARAQEYMLYSVVRHERQRRAGVKEGVHPPNRPFAVSSTENLNRSRPARTMKARRWQAAYEKRNNQR